MPRVSSKNSRFQKNLPPSGEKTFPCMDCGRVFGRFAEMNRHSKLHAPNVEDLRLPCPYEGCSYRTLQKSNLKTHINTHTGETPYKCPDNCTEEFADPGSLCRHRKTRHGYNPVPRRRRSTGSRVKKGSRSKTSSPYTIPSRSVSLESFTWDASTPSSYSSSSSMDSDFGSLPVTPITMDDLALFSSPSFFDTPTTQSQSSESFFIAQDLADHAAKLSMCNQDDNLTWSADSLLPSPCPSNCLELHPHPHPHPNSTSDGTICPTNLYIPQPEPQPQEMLYTACNTAPELHHCSIHPSAYVYPEITGRQWRWVFVGRPQCESCFPQAACEWQLHAPYPGLDFNLRRSPKFVPLDLPPTPQLPTAEFQFDGNTTFGQAAEPEQLQMMDWNTISDVMPTEFTSCVSAPVPSTSAPALSLAGMDENGMLTMNCACGFGCPAGACWLFAAVNGTAQDGRYNGDAIVDPYEFVRDLGLWLRSFGVEVEI